MALPRIALLKRPSFGIAAVLLVSLAVAAAGSPALQDLPQEPFARGKALLLRGKPGDAKASFETALAQTPKILDILYFRGVSWLQLGNTDAALADFRATLSMKPDYALGHAGLAQVWIKKVNYPEAEKEIAAALVIDPNCTEAYYQRGVVQGYLKNTDAAVAAFEKGLEFDSLHAYAHYNLALAYNQKKRKDLTIVHLEKFLTLAPLAPEAPQVRNFLNLLKR